MFMKLDSEGPDSSGSVHNSDKGKFVLFSFEKTFYYLILESPRSNQHVPRTALGCLEQSIAPWWKRKTPEFHDWQRWRDQKNLRELGILEWIYSGSLGKSLTIAAYALQKSYTATHFIRIMDSHKICTRSTYNLSSLSLELWLQNKAH